MDEQLLRRLNLLEILTEEAEDAGLDFTEPPADAAQCWSEQQIREHFSGAAKAVATCHTEAVADGGATSANGNEEADPEFTEPSPHEFRKWFPGLPLSKTATAHPKWQVLCFPNAGNAEDMYTNEGTGPRRAPSPLLEWCRENGAECLAVQPPGRAMRGREPCITRPQELARQLLPIVGSRLAATPWLVVAHSVGTWNAFEFMHLARDAGLPPPQRVFLSAMAAPDIPEQQRPWRRQSGLSEADFQDECRSWDVNEVVFSAALWPTYHSLMRSDFQLFDEYEFEHEGAKPFTCPFTTYSGTRDRKISSAMVSKWQKFTSGPFSQTSIQGHHLWPLDKAAKHIWQSHIAAQLRNL